MIVNTVIFCSDELFDRYGSRSSHVSHTGSIHPVLSTVEEEDPNNLTLTRPEQTKRASCMILRTGEDPKELSF